MQLPGPTHHGQGACLFTKRLERGRFIWPSAGDGVVTISTAQFGYLVVRHRLAASARDVETDVGRVILLALRMARDVIPSLA